MLLYLIYAIKEDLESEMPIKVEDSSECIDDELDFRTQGL